MKFSFHPEAKKELTEAINYYNQCEAGLGYLFMEEVEATIHKILKYPGSWSKISKRTRRCLTRRFPYGVIYQEKGTYIAIISIMHLKRKPDYWKNRLGT
ncbi:MAG: type II toxin-antitoxin system RelE/ParE family toxin [bacterium]|nr:type II toxin-antitoxin system RelE/ParE family toxin [bacterium]